MSDERMEVASFTLTFNLPHGVERMEITELFNGSTQIIDATEDAPLVTLKLSNGVTIGPRVQTPDEIATAIAAARAEGEKAGRDAAAKAIRESKIEYGGDVFHAEVFYSISEACREHYADVVAELSQSTDTTAILAAERAAGREEMRRACITLVRETNMVDSDPESLADEISALVLP